MQHPCKFLIQLFFVSEFHDRIAPEELSNSISNEVGNIKIRKNFPETWIFDSFELGSRFDY
jgi:hypothetical protein